MIAVSSGLIGDQLHQAQERGEVMMPEWQEGRKCLAEGHLEEDTKEGAAGWKFLQESYGF